METCYLNTIHSVSYTHLDVYKRQAVGGCVRKLWDVKRTVCPPAVTAPCDVKITFCRKHKTLHFVTQNCWVKLNSMPIWQSDTAH